MKNIKESILFIFLTREVYTTLHIFALPNGLSNVFEGVLTTGRELRCLFPLRNPVELVSTSDIIPGSSSNRAEFDVGPDFRGNGYCK